MRKAFFIIVPLLAIAAAFEFHPAVEYYRIAVPEEIYVGKDCDCHCISESRPWYSRFNYWFWSWIIIVPILVFSVDPHALNWMRAFRSILSISFGYVLMVASVFLMWDVRNGPFAVVPDFPWQQSWDIPDCANVADGASIAFILLLGWVLASIYTGWWDLIWFQYHKRKSRMIGEGFERDLISKFTSHTSILLPILVIITAAVAATLHMVEIYLKVF